MPTYVEMQDNYGDMKKGEVYEAVEATPSVFTAMVNKKKHIVPMAYGKVVAGPAGGATGSGTGPNFGPAMSKKSASKLSADLGFSGSAFTNLDDTTAQTVAPEPPKPKPKPKLKADEFFLSDMTGGRLPKSGIDHVMKRNPDDTWTPEQLLDIPTVDKFYFWNPDVLEAMWMAYKYNKKMLLTGWPGTGKTTGVIQFAAWVRHPVMRFNGKDGIEASSFLGMIWATKGGMEWRDGLMPQGVRGGYIVLIDEVMKIPTGIQMALQNLYEEGGYLMLDDKPGTVEDKKVIPAPTFRMFLTDNAKGTGDNFDKFAGTQVQDTSTLDRFGVTVTVPYLPSDEEQKMLSDKYSYMKKDDIRQLVKFANLVRNGYIQSSISLTLSPRGLQTVCELYQDIPDIPRVLEMVFTDKIGEVEEQDAVNEMIKTVW